MAQELIGDKSILVQELAWCRQATSHYMSLRRPISYVVLWRYHTLKIFHQVAVTEWVQIYNSSIPAPTTSHSLAYFAYALTRFTHSFYFFNVLQYKNGHVLWPQWHKPQIYFPWRTQHENIRNTHDSVNCRYSLGSTLTYINMKTVRFYVQTAINLLRKCLGTPDCRNMENMLIDFIWLNVQAKYLKQTILYHFKWNMALWKWPKCPQYMQRTW